jgi:hypothetical protein
MCEICNIEKDTAELLMCDIVEAKVGNTVLDEHELSVGILLDADGCHYLVIDYLMQAASVAHVNMQLDYCPNCGRELKHKPKIALGDTE